MLSSILRRSSAVATAAAAAAAKQQQQRFMSVLVVSEPLDREGCVSPATQSTVTAAKQLDSDVELLIVESSSSGTAPTTKVPTGVSKVLHATTPTTTTTPVSETVALAIQQAATSANNNNNFNYILAPSSKFGSTIIPRAAALLGVSPVTDVLSIEGADTFIRPMYAGNALCKVQMSDTLKVLSIRPTAFDKADLVDATTVESFDITPFEKSTWIGESVSGTADQDRPDLGSASTVISGGRGLGSGENFVLLENLATKLGAAVGASRAAVDAGFCPNDWQVGQTGKVVAPELYIAVGISGAIQHLSGMKDSKTIVAINKDPEAPIFQVADYGLVADLFQAVPELTEKV